MTIKELYELAVAEGIENLELWYPGDTGFGPERTQGYTVEKISELYSYVELY